MAHVPLYIHMTFKITFKKILILLEKKTKIRICFFILKQDLNYFCISSIHPIAHFYNRNFVVIHPFKLIKLDSSDAARRSDDNCINTPKHNSTLSVSSAVHFNLNPELLWQDRQKTPSSSSGTSLPT